MTWSTSEIQYEGFPLLLRRPDYPNVWKFKPTFNQLVTVEHILESVTESGLPERSYNKALAEFDHYMCALLEDTNNGIIFLIETYGGKRNYYYYTSPVTAMDRLTKQAEADFKVTLKVRSMVDNDWNFIKSYPVRLYS